MHAEANWPGTVHWPERKKIRKPGGGAEDATHLPAPQDLVHCTAAAAQPALPFAEG